MPWYETDVALIAVTVLFGIAAFSLLMYNDWKEQHAKATPTQTEQTATGAGNPASQYAAALTTAATIPFVV